MLIQWYSKQQSTTESLVFGAEFIVMKLGINVLKGTHYKLWMMGIDIDDPKYLYGDSMSIVKNNSVPISTLNDNYNEICYHVMRESMAMG